MVTINYGGGPGNDILQAAQSLAQQNMQRYALNQQLAQNLSSSFLGGLEFGAKQYDTQEQRQIAKQNLQAKNTAAATQQAIDNKFKQHGLAIQQAGLTPAQQRAAGLSVAGTSPDYSIGGTPVTEPEQPGIASQIMGQNGAPSEPGAGSAGPAIQTPTTPGPGGLPGQYVSANESMNSQAGGGSALQANAPPADIHQHVGQIIENTANDVESHVNGSNLSPEGKVVWNDLLSKRRNIQKQKSSLTQQQYNQASAQWLDEFRNRMGGTNFKNFTIPEVTPEEVFTKNSIQQPDGSSIFFSKSKDGTLTPHHIKSSGHPMDPEEHFKQNTVTKNGVVYGRDNEGNWKKLSDPGDEETFHEQSPSAYLAKNYDKLYEKAEKNLSDKDTAEAATTGNVAPPPTPEKIHAKMLEYVNNKFALFHGMDHSEKMTSEAGKHKAAIDAETIRLATAMKHMGILQPPAGFQPNVSQQPPATPAAALDTIHEPPADQQAAKPDDVAQVIHRGTVLAEYLPGMADEMTHLKSMVQTHGNDPSTWPKTDQAKAERTITKVAINEHTAANPLPKPARQVDMIEGAVYGPVKGPDGKIYQALWNGKKFIPLGTYDTGK